MEPPRLNLLVLRSPDMERARRFYERLGLAFVKHRHGKGAEHYASENGPVVFEIYPSEDAPLSPVRIGFAVASADETVNLLRKAGATILSSPKDSLWGRRAVVSDFDGNKVELVSQCETPQEKGTLP